MQPADPRPHPSESLEGLLSLLQKALGHELPNQLIAVQGLARLLQTDSGDRLSDDGKEYLQRLAAAAQRSHEMVRALADFLRALRAGKPGTRVSVADVVRESAAELNLLYPGRPVVYDFPETGPYVLVPAVVVRQIVGHLLRHALQAGLAEGLRIEVGARQQENSVELWVRDSGPVLSAEQQQKLFEPFACRDNALPGLGLGLVLARQLAENWGGAIGVQSEAGRGTTVSVRFGSAIG
jgi:signal transduction histidine kinase